MAFKPSSARFAFISMMLALGSAAHAETPAFRLSSPDLNQGVFKQQQLLKGFGNH